MRVGVLVVFLACHSAEDPGRRPVDARKLPTSVVLITADTTRADVLGCYGGNATTPAIDALASDGILFHNAHSVAFGTTPSHASLMASATAALHGIYDNETPLPSRMITLAEVLSREGYATAAFVSAVPLAYRLGLGQGFGAYDDDFRFDPSGDLGEFSRHERRARATAERFIAWLDENERRPFFAWLHFYDPHQPYWPVGLEGTPEYLTRPDIDAPRDHATEATAHLRYEAEVADMDREIGRVLERLRTDGTYDSTLVVFVSDHGENFEEHRSLMYGHAGLLRAVTRLPLIVRLPGSAHRGTSSDALVGNIDIGPTVLDVLGVSRPGSWEGHSLRQIIEGKATDVRDHLVLEGADREEIGVRTSSHFYRELAAEVRGDPEVQGYLGYEEGTPIELYAIADDPDESRNVYPTAEALRLQDLAARFLRQRNGRTTAPHLRDEHLRALAALGYTSAGRLHVAAMSTEGESP